MKSIHGFFLGLTTLIIAPIVAWSAQTNITGPAGSGSFGDRVVVLPNGNFVVTDPGFDKSGPEVVDAGAVYLYDPNGVLISTLTGSSASDSVGSAGIKVLSNGNFLVLSPLWHGGGAFGAVTWVNGATGLSGTVSAANSVVGGVANELGNSGIVMLPNGNYLISVFSHGGNKGAVVFGNGNSGTSGAITTANALIGARVVTVLSNGNYVASNFNWTDGVTPDLGAVTWCDGATGRVGTVSAANSLVGVTAQDFIGEFSSGGGVVPLANGNYVVISPKWNNGATVDVGAVTWCDGTTGRTGPVSTANSLHGTSTNDKIGTGALNSNVVPLTNGNYVVVSPSWNKVFFDDNAGAVTWCDGATGRTGPVTAANSITGTAGADAIGFGGVVPLTNGNFVICSPEWNNGSIIDAGAATWCDGTTGFPAGASGFEAVSTANSLTGSTTEDNVGGGFASGGVRGAIALPNGNYIVQSRGWNNGAVPDAGAVTWGNGVTGTTGAVSASNSLVGDQEGEDVGGVETVVLTNGNYVVATGYWDNGLLESVGAVTWCNGATGRTGAVSAANSLVGTHPFDAIGVVTALSNGNYVVCAPSWDNGGFTDAGSATWCDGTTGRVGTVSGSNSVVGTSAMDQVGGFCTPLANGNYVLSVPEWSNGATATVGAVILGNGANGTVGTITSANALVGTKALDRVGSVGVTALPDGNYAVGSNFWDNGAVIDAGAVTVGDGVTGHPVGALSAANSVVGNVTNAAGNFSFDYDATRQQIVVGLPGQNVVARSGANMVQFSADLFTFNEDEGTVNLTIKRTGSLPFSVFVTTSAAGATASAGADYTAINAPGSQIDFLANESTKQVPVTILTGNAVNEPNETFKVVLSNPTNGVVLGRVSTTTVRIIDAGDASDPEAPVISAPAVNAVLHLVNGASTAVTGTAKDDKGIASVEVKLNGGPFLPATLTSNSGMTASYSLSVIPSTGTNTVTVRSTDTSGRPSPETTRTFKVFRPLFVATNGVAGMVTAGYSPFSFREVGKSITVTATASTSPAPGTLFQNWTVTGVPNGPSQIGVTPSGLEKNTITFIFVEDLVLTANFVSNPYGEPGIAGTYNGSILPDGTLPDRPPLTTNNGEDGTLPSNSTQGYFTANLMTTGAFTAKLTIDGLVLNVAGIFDANGNARFGTARTFTLTVPRPNKPSLFVSLQVGAIGMSGQVVARDFQQSVIAAASIIEASRAYFTGLSDLFTVSDEYLTVTGTAPSPAGRTDGVFTVLFPSVPLGSQPVRIQDAGFTEQDYPAGTGIGTVKVSKAGLVTLAGTLADGTAISASSTLSSSMETTLFASLYANKGFVSSRVYLNAFDPDSDFLPTAGTEVLWSRPFNSASHYYPYGWPEVIRLDLRGAKYVPGTTQSSLKAVNGTNLSAPDADGNASLTFSDGQLSEALTKAANVSTTDVVTKVPDNDPTFTLTITRATGAFGGKFIHTDDNEVPYKGVIFQKGANAGGYGFFLTKQPAPITYDGESGGVSLIGEP